MQRGDDHVRAVPAPRGGRRRRPGFGHPLLLTPGVFDATGIDPTGTWQAHLAEACRIFDEMDGRQGRLHVGFGPHAAYSLPPDGLSAVAQEAQRRDAMVQIHLSETEAECRVVEERYGMSAPALLASLGVFDGAVLAAHAVWLDSADMAVMAEHDVAVAHCPGSNGKLGSGVARLTEMLARGIRVGLGTDGPASNDDLHLWDEMRLAAIRRGHRGIRPSSARPPPSGWPPGAAGRRWCAGRGPEVGRPADIIRLRTDDARFGASATTAELLGHLVWAGAGYLVTDVWVGGEAMVTDGLSVQIDGERARDEVGSGPTAFSPRKSARRGIC